MKKIIIFYASYGGGHLSAARSIKQYIDSNYSDMNVELIDCVKYISNALDKVTTTAYKEMAKRLHGLGEEFMLNPKKVHSLILVLLPIN